MFVGFVVVVEDEQKENILRARKLDMKTRVC